MLFYHVISFSFRLYLHAFIIIPPLIIRKSREVTIENKPPRGFTPPSWASEKGRWMKNCQGNYDDLIQNGVNLESPWLLLTRPKSLSPVCKNPNLFERGTNSFPFLSFPFFFFFFLFQKNASRVFIIPFRNVRAPLIFLRDIKPEECGNGGIYIYIRRNGISCLARKKVTLRMRYREGEAIVKK